MGAGDVVQWQSTCLAWLRLLVQSPVQKKEVGMGGAEGLLRPAEALPGPQLTKHTMSYHTERVPGALRERLTS